MKQEQLIAGAVHTLEKINTQNTMTGTTTIISKQEIDDYFTKNYDFLVLTITKTKNKYNPNSNWNTTDLLTDTYEHLLNNKHKIIKSNSNIQAFVMRYLTNQVRWYNSKINKMDRGDHRLTNLEVIYEFCEDFDDEYCEYLNISSDLKLKIDYEKQYNTQLTILSDFYLSLDRVDQLFYDAMFNKNIEGHNRNNDGVNTINALNKYFKINKNAIGARRIELMGKLNQYIKENYTKIYK
jgi:hypothetical protein